jgi:hypothetical protein
MAVSYSNPLEESNIIDTKLEKEVKKFVHFLI